MQYAIISTGGKQYLAKPGSELVVESLPQQAGETVTFAEVLLHADGDKVAVGAPFVDGLTVIATVVRHDLGEKLDILKYRPKSRYRRRMGHRQHQTVLKIESIGAAKKATKTAEGKK